jgi:hypothetical protein
MDFETSGEKVHRKYNKMDIISLAKEAKHKVLFTPPLPHITVIYNHSS